MSKKGAFIYQQIELTTAEWATNTTLYPASVWLFERLENGKFNMKLSDGVHTFAELPTVLQDITATVKTNDATTYILTITTAAGSFDTPNLRGTNGIGATVEVVSDTATDYKLKFTSASGEVTTSNLKPQNYDDTAVRNALTALQQQVNTLVSGNASAAIESFNEIIAFLSNVEDSQTLAGIIAGINQSIANVQATVPTKTSQLQNDDNVVKDAGYIHTDNNYSDEEKQKVADSLRFKDKIEVTTLTDLPVTKYSIEATLSAASPISFAGTPVPGMEYMIDILNSGSADFDQPLPNADNCQSNETSVTCPTGKVTAISVRYIHGKYVFRV
ncbi:hypothetical protein [Parabacteroides provencensis]|uniref:hypothetical protein n=1 Tax=Parabacteroides provencensis TaxID=1944636 RepID=UPI000C14BF3E|nr:hypothetical protein [Parabacteroides provencensis]